MRWPFSRKLLNTKEELAQIIQCSGRGGNPWAMLRRLKLILCGYSIPVLEPHQEVS